MSETAIFGPTAPEIRGFTQLREEKKHNLKYSKTTLQKLAVIRDEATSAKIERTIARKKKREKSDRIKGKTRSVRIVYKEVFE